jgi:hypothetical protein
MSTINNNNERLESKIDGFGKSIEVISETLIQIVLLNQSAKECEKHRDMKDLEDKDTQKLLHEHETKITQLVETRNWILIGIGLVVSAVIIALVALVVK